ncbi:baseplate assembly protein [Rahnella aquatilis]|nr:baseplate assembly protein [Rahnella aquatilis]
MNIYYLGMNSAVGDAITEIDHIRQSVTDILTTPKGTRVMRRDYGSDLPDLIDQPQNPALNLKISSAAYSALMKFEPRITVTSATVNRAENAISVDITGYRTDSQQALAMSVSLKKVKA